jgi:hypothetical protein
MDEQMPPVQESPPHGTSKLYQIQHLSDILMRKEEVYRKRTQDFITVRLKVKNARSKMA